MLRFVTTSIATVRGRRRLFLVGRRHLVSMPGAAGARSFDRRYARHVRSLTRLVGQFGADRVLMARSRRAGRGRVAKCVSSPGCAGCSARRESLASPKNGGSSGTPKIGCTASRSRCGAPGRGASNIRRAPGRGRRPDALAEFDACIPESSRNGSSPASLGPESPASEVVARCRRGAPARTGVRNPHRPHGHPKAEATGAPQLGSGRRSVLSARPGLDARGMAGSCGRLACGACRASRSKVACRSAARSRLRSDIVEELVGRALAQSVLVVEVEGEPSSRRRWNRRLAPLP